MSVQSQTIFSEAMRGYALASIDCLSTLNQLARFDGDWGDVVMRGRPFHGGRRELRGARKPE